MTPDTDTLNQWEEDAQCMFIIEPIIKNTRILTLISALREARAENENLKDQLSSWELGSRGFP